MDNFNAGDKMKIDDDHYLKMKVQPRELYAAVPAFQAYPMLVAIKYVSRAAYKGQERRDLEQAHNTLNWVMDDPTGMPYLNGQRQWELYLDQFDLETYHILEKIGGHYFGAAQYLIKERLKALDNPVEGAVQRTVRHFFGK